MCDFYKFPGQIYCMRTLIPQDNQTKAIDSLGSFYKKKYQLSAISSTINSQNNFANQQVDILINFNSHRQKGHTVIIETKSFSDLQSQLSFNNYKYPLLTLATILSALFAYYYSGLLPWYGIFGITAVLLISLWEIIKVVQRFFRERKTEKIIDLLGKSPANEKWIAVTKPGLNLLKRKKSFSYLNTYNSLSRQCIRKRIGLLLISKKGSQIIQKAGFVKGNYLDQYTRNNTSIIEPMMEKI